MIVQHNRYQRTIFFRQSSSLFCHISSYISDIGEYFNLKAINEKLVAENTGLKNTIEKLKSSHPFVSIDTSKSEGDYLYMNARTVNANFNKTKNYITLDKGIVNGIRKEMAVTSRDGVVGIIQNQSGIHLRKHYYRYRYSAHTALMS